jgi:predicted O-methyltransferase YrrM
MDQNSDRQSVIFFLKLLRYKLFAKHRKGFGIHSPFLYGFIRNVLNSEVKDRYTPQIEDLRKELLSNSTKIKVHDLGAGSKEMKSNARKIQDIVRYSAIKKKYGELLFRIIQHYRLKTILELGTSLGIGTGYLAKAFDDAIVYTVEGCPETSKIAAENFILLGLNNIHQIIGDIDKELFNVLKKTDTLDFVFFDGNHQKEPTMRYFSECLNKIRNETVFYFDDIHWSRGMEEAWKEIKSNQKVTITVDLFFSGIVFFRKELSKQNYTVRF